MNTSTHQKRAKDIMTAPVVTVPESALMREMVSIMLEKGIGALVVVDTSGKAIGLISESDIAGIRKSLPFSLTLAPLLIGARAPSDSELKQILSQGSKLTAKQVMSDGLLSVTEETSLGEVMHLILEKNVKHLPVVKNGEAVGIIARHDLLRLFAVD